MTQFVVRQLEPEVKSRLKARALRAGRSMEAEVREILRAAAAEKPSATAKLGSRIAARFSAIGLTVDLAELRGQSPRPADFTLKTARPTKVKRS